ncbi:MAG: hypothetical protein JO013_10260 [Alphaproteobacteria bacterium]|nr:hypothetical protein [Alphaproteobacteria bacterium]
MCHFITLVVPSCDMAAVRAVMARHGRAAEPTDNPSIGRAMLPGERQMLTTKGHCDCGTILAARHPDAAAFDKKLGEEAERLRRRGWSPAKIARALEDRRKADARPRGGGGDSLELWTAVLRDLEAAGLPYAALLVREYHGAIATEVFDVSRSEAPADTPLRDALARIRENELTLFHFAKRAAAAHWSCDGPPFS